ncbi:MAG: hypothetical protein AAB386_00955 [Patescibacteria group bacterium]
MSGKRAPINTGMDTLASHVGLLADAFVLGQGGAILQQEAQGQRSFVASETLPTDMTAKDKAGLEKAGVRFGAKVEGDDLFQYVELPAGWKKVPTDHSMHSNLLDDKGRERAGITYKAAFYDRYARLDVSCRFSYCLNYDRENENVTVAHVTDSGKVIHTTEPIKYESEKRHDSYDAAYEQARAWLDERYPDWQDPSAYWD